jgi:phosphatidylserine/phosphatidylglycerophosphate/cardiolipin synthase-like enzyme
MSELNYTLIDLESLLEKIEYYKSNQILESWSKYDLTEEDSNSGEYYSMFQDFNNYISKLKIIDAKKYSRLKEIYLTEPKTEVQTDESYRYFTEFFYTPNHLTELEFELKKALKYLKPIPPEVSSKNKNSKNVEFVAEDKLNSSIIEIINEAQEYLTLITPYLKLHTRLKDALKAKSKELNLILLYGKEELNPNERAFFDRFSNFQILYKKRLHAKCYFNEKKVLITSMNLYEFSHNNNVECGILVHREANSELYNEIVSYFKNVLKSSEKK